MTTNTRGDRAPGLFVVLGVVRSPGVPRERSAGAVPVQAGRPTVRVWRHTEPPFGWNLSWKEDGATCAKWASALRTRGRPHRSLRVLDVPHTAADLVSSPLPRTLYFS